MDGTRIEPTKTPFFFQVKHLIRALFQNTDHRAAVLARIK